MTNGADRLVLDMLAWIALRPRSYAETIAAWRSSCPRHPVWDDALVNGLVQVERGGTDGRREVTLTARGRARLDEQS